MRKLDIIIPQYQEDSKTITRLLTSIASQKGIDFNSLGILIINDNSNTKITKFVLDAFPQLNIILLFNEKNVGPGITRQNGINASSAEYITFLDADDTYYSNTCLKEVYDVLYSKEPKILLTKWMEEYKENNKYKIILHESDIIYLHGKFIKREYLIQQNIQFSPHLRFHEDSFFSTLLLLTANESSINKSATITNFWRFRQNSLVRKQEKDHYLVRTFPHLLNSNQELIKELKLRNCNKLYEYQIKALTYLYCILNSPLFNKSLGHLKETYEVLFYNFLCDNLDVFEKLKQFDIATYMNEQIQIFKNFVSSFPFVESWQEFITRLSNKFENE